MIEVSNFEASYINVIPTCRSKIVVDLWLLLWLQVAELGAS